MSLQAASSSASGKSATTAPLCPCKPQLTFLDRQTLRASYNPFRCFLGRFFFFCLSYRRPNRDSDCSKPPSGEYLEMLPAPTPLFLPVYFSLPSPPSPPPARFFNLFNTTSMKTTQRSGVFPETLPSSRDCPDVHKPPPELLLTPQSELLHTLFCFPFSHCRVTDPFTRAFRSLFRVHSVFFGRNPPRLSSSSKVHQRPINSPSESGTPHGSKREPYQTRLEDPLTDPPRVLDGQ